MRHPLAPSNCTPANTNTSLTLEVSCNATFDQYLCWPQLAAGFTASQPCPPVKLSDTNRRAYRSCGTDGVWLGKNKEPDPKGWTDYSECFPDEARILLEKVSNTTIIEIAQRTRYLEIAGFSVSFIALLFSLYIFTRYPRLNNHRTMIHRHLTGAMILQVFLKLFIYADQFFMENMESLCVPSYIASEYAITAMFFWMLVEGIYLDQVVTVNPFNPHVSPILYRFIGWFSPLVITSVWVVIKVWQHKSTESNFCWYGYQFEWSFRIVMQGPRLSVIGYNFIILVKTLITVVEKLRWTRNTEMKKARKAVHAAIVLLPLLGITNIFQMVKVPLGSEAWVFALWSYTTYFLSSFQGFFISVIYCFTNGEVLEALKKEYNDYKEMNAERRRRFEQDHRDVEADHQDRYQMNDRLRPYFDVSPRAAFTMPWSGFTRQRCASDCPVHGCRCLSMPNLTYPVLRPPPPSVSNDDFDDADEFNIDDLSDDYYNLPNFGNDRNYLDDSFEMMDMEV